MGLCDLQARPSSSVSRRAWPAPARSPMRTLDAGSWPCSSTVSLVDIVIFTPIIVLLGARGVTAQGRGDLPPAENLGLILFQYLLPALYEILMVGKFGATLGKMAMGIKVVTPEGQPISYGRSTGRYFGKMLSGIILGIGYLMAFWDPEKRALHDRICHTRVVSVPRS